MQPFDSISQVGSKVHEQRVCASLKGSLSGRSRTSQSSTTSCLLDERIKLTADKAAMIAEVSLLCESGSLAQEKNRLENQEKQLKLKTDRDWQSRSQRKGV